MGRFFLGGVAALRGAAGGLKDPDGRGGFSSSGSFDCVTCKCASYFAQDDGNNNGNSKNKGKNNGNSRSPSGMTQEGKNNGEGKCKCKAESRAEKKVLCPECGVS
jgi:hypothetical protein